MKNYPNRKSLRLKKWDYSSNGYYFITVCAQHKQHVFGNIINEHMQLSPIGKIAADEWIKTQHIRPYVCSDEWIIMPDHLHGIIGIDKTLRTAHRAVPTPNGNLSPNSIGSIIGQFKSICTKRIRAAGFSFFAWQPRFYDHIIRNDKDLDRVRQYIRNNLLKWDLDDTIRKNNSVGAPHEPPLHDRPLFFRI